MFTGLQPERYSTSTHRFPSSQSKRPRCVIDTPSSCYASTNESPSVASPTCRTKKRLPHRRRCCRLLLYTSLRHPSIRPSIFGKGQNSGGGDQDLNTIDTPSFPSSTNYSKPSSSSLAGIASHHPPSSRAKNKGTQQQEKTNGASVAYDAASQRFEPLIISIRLHPRDRRCPYWAWRHPFRAQPVPGGEQKTELPERRAGGCVCRPDTCPTGE